MISSNIVLIIVAFAVATAAIYALYSIILFQGVSSKGDDLQLTTKNILDQVDVLYSKKEYALVQLLASKYLDRVPGHTEVRKFLAKAYLEDRELNSVLEDYFNEGTDYPKYKLDKFEIEIENYNSDYNDIYKKTYELVKKNLDKIKKQAAKFMYNKLSSYDEDFKFTEKEIYNKIFIQFAPCMEYFPNVTVPTCQVNISYDAKPYLDPNHVFSIYCEYYPETGKFTYNDYVYDG